VFVYRGSKFDVMNSVELTIDSRACNIVRVTNFTELSIVCDFLTKMYWGFWRRFCSPVRATITETQSLCFKLQGELKPIAYNHLIYNLPPRRTQENRIRFPKGKNYFKYLSSLY